MLRLYAPVAVSLVLIGSLTVWEGVYSDRMTSSSVDAAEFGKRFESVPKKVGVWVGEDRKEEKETLEMAGAVNHVSRTYINGETNQQVDLWLIVGHSRDICRHTPDICYPSHGFSQMGNKVKQRVEPPGEPAATFYTSKFRNDAQRGGTMTRVFWAWNGNEPDKDQWDAPTGEGMFSFVTGNPQKLYYGNNTALYKVYFTAKMADKDEPAGDNVAIDFAKLMIPEINRALFPERYPAGESMADGEAASAAGEAALDLEGSNAIDPLSTTTGETSGHAPASETTPPPVAPAE